MNVNGQSLSLTTTACSNSTSARRSLFGLLALCSLFVAPSVHAVDWTPIAFWPMDGPVGQTTMEDYWGESNAGRVLDGTQVESGRLGGWAFHFRGTNKNSRAVVDNDSGLNPGNRDFRVRMKFKFDKDIGPQSSWNLVQKGRYGNRGGQWKLELSRNAGNSVSFRCSFQRPRESDGSAGEQFAVKVLDRGTSLQKGKLYELSCRLNRSSSRVQIVAGVRNVEQNRWTWGVKNTEISQSAFGSIAPYGGCYLGSRVNIGGKSYCANENPGSDDLADDMFRGFISYVKVYKGS